MPTPDRARRRRFVASALLSLSGLFSAATVAMVVASWNAPLAETWGTSVGACVWATLILAFPVVGWLIVRRAGTNVIGWLLLAIGVTATFAFATSMYAAIAVVPGSHLPYGPEIGNGGNWSFMPWIVMIGVFLPQLFPDGRPLSPRWRRLLWVLGALSVAAIVSSALTPGPLEIDPRVTNPFGVRSPIVDVLGIGFAALPGGTLLSVVAVVLRYRRSGPLERAQLRWFMSAIVTVAMTFLAALVLLGFAPEGLSRPWYHGVIADLANASWSLIAVAIGIAVFRYRLYAIDVVIERALVYGSLTAILAGVYFGVIVALQFVLRPLAGESDVAIAGSTLVVAALFRPLRRRIQSFIDRRFYRARYDAGRLVESFAGRMRQRVDLEGITAELQTNVQRSVQPASTSVWVRLRR